VAPTPRHVFKIVVTGPFAAGKTTFVETVVDRDFLTTSAGTSRADESGVKHATTVGMDFGALTLEDPDGDVELRVYGTPGQERFSFMWDVLGEGADGFVLVVDGRDDASWPDSLAHLRAMQRLGIPGVVAVNRAAGGAVVDRAAEFYDGHATPVLGCQAVDPDDVADVLVAVLAQVLDRLEAGGSDTQAPAETPDQTPELVPLHSQPGGHR
jgi:signal recognition particle receptor subunit beta